MKLEMLFGAFGRLLYMNHSSDFQDFRVKPYHPRILLLSEKELLDCYWSLVETECIKMDFLVTVRCELPIMKRLWSDTPRHKAKHTQLLSIIRVKNMILDMNIS